MTQLRTWHEDKTREREKRRSGFYVFISKAEIDPLLGKAKKVLRITIFTD